MDKQYAGLRELAEDRRKKLDHTYHHFLLSREVEDLEHWISERDVVASSQEMGQDLDHVTVTKLQNHSCLMSDGLIYLLQSTIKEAFLFISKVFDEKLGLREPSGLPVYSSAKT